MEKFLLASFFVIIYGCVVNNKIVEKVTLTSNNQPLILKNLSSYSVEGAIQSGQGLYQAMNNIAIDNESALAIINALRDEVEFTKLQVGDKLKARFDQWDRLISFTYSQNPAEFHTVTFNSVSKSWNYQFKAFDTIWKPRLIEGSLSKNSTLENDLLNLGIERKIVGEIVNVLLCKINFRFNARVGDKFKILLNERKLRDEIIETEVLYTSYNGDRAGNVESFYYKDPEKKSTYSAHYTAEGEALIRSGLRYPLSSLHIRSGYGRRIHPVTGQRSMHRGVDLRGRIGRAVHAVAKGKVIVSNYDKYSGNKIAIRHRDGSVSYYLHLNKRHVVKGQGVNSYQVIGTVGKTGRVTGAHLHFGFKNAKGRWMNPMNKRMIATPKLQGQRLISLKSQVKNIQNNIQDIYLNRISNYLAQNRNQNEQENPFQINF